MGATRKFKDIDEYVKSFPPDVQVILEKVRNVIHTAAPEAEEAISYQMPTFKLYGNLVHFAAYEHHLGFYPIPSALKKFATELLPYESGKGSVQFPLDQPIPYELLRKIVEFRVKENVAKAQRKEKPGTP